MPSIQKNIKYLLLLIIAFIRFSYEIPVIFLDDSVKYFTSLQILDTKYALPLVFDGLNFSLFNEAISLFFQKLFDGSLSELIIFQKLLGILSTIIFYFILVKFFKVKDLYAAVAAFIFGINPFMLYIEQCIMPEAFFIVLALLSVVSFAYFFHSEKKMTSLICLGLILSLMCLVKETVYYWSLLIIGFFIVINSIKFFKTKDSQVIFQVLALIISFQVFSLPSRIYNLNKYGQASVHVTSTKGVILYSISPEMLEKPCDPKYNFMQKTILSLRDQNLARFKENNQKLSSADLEFAYSDAISKLNVAGRAGKLVDPRTGQAMSSLKWADYCMQYSISKFISYPGLFIKRIFEVSLPNLFLNENYTLNFRRKSQRPGLDTEIMQFVFQPYSKKSKFDPALKKATPISPEAVKAFLAQKKLPNNEYLFMYSRNSGNAFKLKVDSISLILQDPFKDFAYGKVLFPVFLLLLIWYLFKVKITKEDSVFLFCIFSTLFFIVFPLLITMCEARYRLQFEPFMLLALSLLIYRLKSPPESK